MGVEGPGDRADGAAGAGDTARGASWWRAALAAAAGFVLAGTVAGAVAVAVTDADVALSPTPGPTPTRTVIDVELLAVAPSPIDLAAIDVTLRNAGSPVNLERLTIEGEGYETSELGRTERIPSDAGTTLTLRLLPSCGAGVGVPRSPRLVMRLRGPDGSERTIRITLDEQIGVPALLLGRCDAPLASGARVSVVPLTPGADGSLRLRVGLAAGRGLLWIEGVESSGGVVFQGLEGLPVLVAPGARRTLELTLSITDCASLERTGDPLVLSLAVRREPGEVTRSLPLAGPGGASFRRAVADAVRRAC